MEVSNAETRCPDDQSRVFFRCMFFYSWSFLTSKQEVKKEQHKDYYHIN